MQKKGQWRKTLTILVKHMNRKKVLLDILV